MHNQRILLLRIEFAGLNQRSVDDGAVVEPDLKELAGRRQQFGNVFPKIGVVFQQTDALMLRQPDQFRDGNLAGA